MSESVEWLTVNAGTIWLGSDDGRISIHPIKTAPRHQVRINYSFEITKKAYPMYENRTDIHDSSEAFPVKEYEGEALRPPTEAEWDLAYSQGLLSKPQSEWEDLADRRSVSGYWGQRCDGYPRTTSHPVKMELKKRWRGDEAVTAHRPDSLGEPHASIVTRLVRLPVGAREKPDDPPRLPLEDERKSLILREIFIALLIGILPAFLWAFNFASRGYIAEGWANIAMGGIAFSLATGLVLRPKRASYHVSTDGAQMEKCTRSCSHSK